MKQRKPARQSSRKKTQRTSRPHETWNGTLLEMLPEEEFGVEELDLYNTHARVERMWAEILGGYRERFKFTLFPNSSGDQSQLIVVRDIDFVSTCAHHLLPFRGKAHVGYLPDGVICGLSKIPRTVNMFARRLQTQERLGVQIADFLEEKLRPKAVLVSLTAEHLCMSVRGVKAQHASTVTTVLRGLATSSDSLKHEFLNTLKL